MTDVLRKLTTGFVSTLVFLAVFAGVGDVLIAAGIAIAVAVVQLVLSVTAQGRPGVVGWSASLASLAIVLILTGTSLAGESAPVWTPVSTVNCTGLHCGCGKPLPI